MTKVAVYPYRSHRAGRDLRFSLRSLFEFAPGFEPLVVGDREPWYTGLICDFKHHGELDALSNVIAKISHITKAPEVPELFLLMNDDFYLLEKLKLINATLPINSQKVGIHQRIYDETISRLVKSGVPLWETLDYEGHWPLFLSKSATVAAVARWGVAPYQYRTMFANFRGPQIQTEYRIDVKFRTWDDKYTPINLREEGLPYFSTSNDVAEAPGFEAWIAARWPNPSPWEAGA